MSSFPQSLHTGLALVVVGADEVPAPWVPLPVAEPEALVSRVVGVPEPEALSPALVPAPADAVVEAGPKEPGWPFHPRMVVSPVMVLTTEPEVMVDTKVDVETGVCGAVTVVGTVLSPEPPLPATAL